MLDTWLLKLLQFGRPLHIRTDHGGENMHVRGEGSDFTGSSVHNQRIENFNRDLNRNCYQVFFFCLHYIFLPRINHTLEKFKGAHNNHSLSSERNRTPVRLFAIDNDLAYLHNPENPTAVSGNSLSDRFFPFEWQWYAGAIWWYLPSSKWHQQWQNTLSENSTIYFLINL